MKARNLIIVAIAAIAVYYLRIVSAVKTSIDVSPGKLSNFSFKGGQISWTQNIEIVNTSGVSIPVTGANIYVSFGTSQIGTATILSRSVIRPNATSIIPTLVRISYWSIPAIATELLNLLRTGNIKVRMQGYISAVGATVPLDQQINEKLPFALNI